MTSIRNRPARSDAAAPTGLRALHKMRTRTAIRTAAMTLFAENGYAATTVEQIARAAEVSHTTFFRYFQTKEQVVLSDDLDERKAALLAQIPPGLSHFDLLRRIVRDLSELIMSDTWASNRQRANLILTEPLLLEAVKAEAEKTVAKIGDFFADYLGVERDDLRMRVFLGAAGGVMSALVHESLDRPTKRAFDTLIEAINLLEQGLPLRTAPAVSAKPASVTTTDGEIVKR